MKKTKEETAKTRRTIIEVASKEFRRNGIHKTGVAEVMAAAGMTQGGFYRHFDSKDHLVAEACADSFRCITETLKTAIENGDEVFRLLVDNYIASRGHPDYSTGCPIVFLGSELARADPKSRQAASEGYRKLVDAISKAERFKHSPSGRAEAMFMLSALVGAATISRIVDDPKLSDLILKDTKKHLDTLYSNKQKSK